MQAPSAACGRRVRLRARAAGRRGRRRAPELHRRQDGGQGWYDAHADPGSSPLPDCLGDPRWPRTGTTDGRRLGRAGRAGRRRVLPRQPRPLDLRLARRRAVALIDWDYLHPAPRLSDIAYALRWFAPLRSDAHALEWHHFPAVPDRAARVGTFVAAYGDLPPFDVADAVIRRIRAVIELVAQLADRGVEPQRTWVADGANDRELEEIVWIEAHRSEL